MIDYMLLDIKNKKTVDEKCNDLTDRFNNEPHTD